MRAIPKDLRTANSAIFFFFNDTATTEIYTLSLHDALPISAEVARVSLAADRHVQHRRPARPSLRVEVHELVDDWRLLGAEGRGHACRRFQLAAVPLTIGKGERVRQEPLVAGDRQRGRRVHAAREQYYGGLHLTRLAWHP